MDAVKGAVGCAAVALFAGLQLSHVEPARRAALLASVRAAVGASAPDAVVAAPPVQPFPPASVPPVSVPPRAGEEVIAPDRYGQFETAVEIGGRRMPALVDTGATFVALTAEDADRLGLRLAPSDFRYRTSTANGVATAAKVELASVRLGTIEVRGVTAFVVGRGRLGQTLLGMSFLSRLGGVRLEGGRLHLSQ